MIDSMQFHPACLMLPNMADHEFNALKQSIAKGWDDKKEPILLCDGMILDGRHRYLAASEVGVTPKFSQWPGDANPYRFVWEQHDARRSWRNATQRQLCFEDCDAAAQEWDKELRKIRDEANAARSEKAKEQHAVSNPRAGERSGSTTNCGTTKRHGHQTGEKKKAALAGTNRGAVQRASKIRKGAEELGQPEIIEAVKSGSVSEHAVIKQIDEERRKRNLTRPVDTALPAGLHHGDFRELSAQIADSSVDLIFTDPPYDDDSVALYGEIARIAARVLKPGASLIAYSGQRHLPDVYAAMIPHLRYWWTGAVIHDGGNQILQKLGIRCGWKPLVWFVKGTRGDVQNVMLDTVRGDREKFAHAWQQAQSEAEYFIGKLTAEGGVVVDFCLGGGTTAAAAKELGRRFIGFEVDASAIEIAVKRLA